MLCLDSCLCVTYELPCTLHAHCMSLFVEYIQFSVYIHNYMTEWDLAYGTLCPLTSSAAELCRLSERH